MFVSKPDQSSSDHRAPLLSDNTAMINKIMWHVPSYFTVCCHIMSLSIIWIALTQNVTDWLAEVLINESTVENSPKQCVTICNNVLLSSGCITSDENSSEVFLGSLTICCEHVFYTVTVEYIYGITAQNTK